ncbi:hypothetical protein ElyMa_005791000 [Elysia marginata]|uniref:YqaJ viral recombinase domain-containing protein n=1 Tax=Elysia marginata TaxID=1093978 RepID=A0AAV4FRN2_9GAST|nr:hypothetical protein ElyMa_005791000 [Elysia marginata]
MEFNSPLTPDSENDKMSCVDDSDKENQNPVLGQKNPEQAPAEADEKHDKDDEVKVSSSSTPKRKQSQSSSDDDKTPPSSQLNVKKTIPETPEALLPKTPSAPPAEDDDERYNVKTDEDDEVETPQSQPIDLRVPSAPKRSKQTRRKLSYGAMKSTNNLLALTEDEINPPESPNPRDAAAKAAKVLMHVEEAMLSIMSAQPPGSDCEMIRNCFYKQDEGIADETAEMTVSRLEAAKRLETLTATNSDQWLKAKQYFCGSSGNLDIVSNSVNRVLEILPVTFGGVRKNSPLPVARQIQGKWGEKLALDILKFHLGSEIYIPGKMLSLRSHIFSASPDALVMNGRFQEPDHFMDHNDSVAGFVEVKTSHHGNSVPIDQLKTHKLSELFAFTKPTYIIASFCTMPSVGKVYPEDVTKPIMNGVMETTEWFLTVSEDGDVNPTNMTHIPMTDAKLFLKLFTSELGRQIIAEAIVVSPFVKDDDINVYIPLMNVQQTFVDEDDDYSHKFQYMLTCKFVISKKWLAELTDIIINKQARVCYNYAVLNKLMDDKLGLLE